LTEIHQLLLVVQGKLDPSVDLAVMDVFLERTGSQVKELYWMEHSSHCVILDEECEQVEKLPLDFLKRVLPDHYENR
jgi:esterase/lipase